MLPGFSGRDLVAVLINYNDDRAERWLSVLIFCPMIQSILPCQKSLSNSCFIVRLKTST